MFDKTIDIFVENPTFDDMGGRKTFLVFFYKKMILKGYKIREFYGWTNSAQPKNGNKKIEYIQIKKIQDYLKFDVGNDVFCNTFFFRRGWKIKNIKKIKNKIKGKLIFQQHTDPDTYNKRGISSVFNYGSFYTIDDANAFNVKKYFTEYIMGSDGVATKKWEGGKGIIFSGRASKANIKPILKVIGDSRLTISIPAKTKYSEGIKKNENVSILIGKPEYHKYDFIIQLEKKGYGISVLEAMSNGLPAIIIDNYPSCKYIAPLEKYRGKNKREIREIIIRSRNNQKNADYQKSYFEKNINGWSDRFVKKFIEITKY